MANEAYGCICFVFFCAARYNGYRDVSNMKVSDIGKVSRDTTGSQHVQGKHAAADAGFAFERQLTSLNEAQYAEYVKKMTQKITDQGEVIKKKADMTEMQKYRQLISELLDETASNAYAFVKSNSYNRGGQHKLYTVIRMVNEKLDAMTQEILAEQTDNLKLLDMVDDIRGLLLDLFM